ncbi:MAG: ABC transporter ATP-binding protein [Gemmatimonadota bacterium]
MILEARDLTVRYGGSSRPAVDGVTLSTDGGRLVAIVGPNGSGKTTLLRAMLGLLPLSSGSANVQGRPVAQWPRAELAKVIGVVPQTEERVFPLRVRESVMLGRYARLGALGRESTVDRQAVDEAMTRSDVLQFADRRVDTLSGGEWQRVRVARALAQEPAALVLDEPTASLDVRHEMEVFELIRHLVTGGLAGLIVTHHLNLAARYADRMIMLEEGRVAADGTPTEVLRQDVVARVFGWPVAVTTWCDGSPQVVPLRPGEAR